MPASAIDYVMATLGFISIFVLLSGAALALMLRSINYAESMVFFERTNLVVDQFILSYGEPLDWYKPSFTPGIPWPPGNWTIPPGPSPPPPPLLISEYEYPEAFGLGRFNKTSYILNPFKICRLQRVKNISLYGVTVPAIEVDPSHPVNPQNEFYVLLGENYSVPYSYVISNLGLAGEYGFRLTFTPILNASLVQTRISGSHINFTIYVSSMGEPVYRAKIRAILLYASRPPGYLYPIPASEYGRTYTSIEGIGELSFNASVGLYPWVLFIAVSMFDTTNYFIFTANDPQLSLIYVSPLGESIVVYPYPLRVGSYTLLNVSAWQFILSKESPTGFIPVNLTETPIEFIEVVPPGDRILKKYAVINLSEPWEQSYILLGTLTETTLPDDTKIYDWHVYVVPWGIPYLGREWTYGGRPTLFTVAIYYRVARIGECTYRVKIEFWREEG